MTLNQIISILKARWIIAASVMAFTLIAVIILTLVLPKKYTAEAAVVVDVKSPDPIVGMVLPGLMSPGYMATQVEVIKSERVARTVISSLRLDQVDQLRSQWRDETDGQGDYTAWLSELLLKNLDVRPSRDSNVIKLEYTGAEPSFAALLANAFMRAYINTALELRTEPAKQYDAMFQEQSAKLRSDVEKAQARLSEYQKANGLLATDERMDVENARLAELSSQVVSLQSVTAETRVKQSSASQNSQEVLNNPVVGSLRAEASRSEAKLKELKSRYGDSHPLVQEAEANLKELTVKLNAEISRVTSSLAINNSVSGYREAQVKALLEAQREKVIKLKEQRDEAQVLIQDVMNSQKAYENARMRQSQSSLESQSTQTNVSVLQSASPPTKASFPRPLLNVALAIFAGGILATGCALAMELTDRRLRSDDDLKAAMNWAPLLGAIPHIALKAPAATNGMGARLTGGGGGPVRSLSAPAKP